MPTKTATNLHNRVDTCERQSVDLRRVLRTWVAVTPAIQQAAQLPGRARLLTCWRYECTGWKSATADRQLATRTTTPTWSARTPDGSSGWAFTDGTNPRYVKGLCAAPAINLSGNTILTGETCADATTCLDAFPFNDYFDDLEGGLPISKILTWQQYGPGYGGDLTLRCRTTNLDDQSWENPYDMAKGHRGFLAGDMVMAMYGWTNNWQALTDANDIVNLYVRRSFDGGKTWSTLPASFTHTNDITYTGDGTTTCEWMGETVRMPSTRSASPTRRRVRAGEERVAAARARR